MSAMAPKPEPCSTGRMSASFRMRSKRPLHSLLFAAASTHRWPSTEDTVFSANTLWSFRLCHTLELVASAIHCTVASPSPPPPGPPTGATAIAAASASDGRPATADRCHAKDRCLNAAELSSARNERSTCRHFCARGRTFADVTAQH
eukprot:6671926-Pyramimonas_sp.AAC.1